MKFSSKEDIEVPIAEVFAILSEFEVFERSAIRRGIEVQRVEDSVPLAVGLAWDARFSLRGKLRDVRLVLTEFEPPNTMVFEADSQGITGTLTVELLALSPRRTRMAIALNLKPKTLSARLLVQSLKLAKSSLTKQFKLKIADYATSLEDRHSKLA